MDWAKAIDRNSEALKGIVATLFAMLGLDGSAAVARLSKPLHRDILRLLRPAESALRRLIVIAARGLVVKSAPSRPMPQGHIIKKSGTSHVPFQLFDTRKRFDRPCRPKGKWPEPRIHFFDFDLRSPLFRQPASVAPAPVPDNTVSAVPLGRRLQALKHALEDLPGQAKRFARWRARREKMPSPKFTSPMRPGYPPGHRKKPRHEVDHVLSECHALAWDALKPDTS